MKLSTFLYTPLAIWLPLLSDAKTAPNLPKEATPETPWEDLKAVLSSPDILTPGSVAEWKEQCVQIFEDVAQMEGIDGSYAVVSNYLLLNQSSGLCLDNVGCAYEKCMWPPASETWPTFPSDANPFVSYPGWTLDDSDTEEGKVLLPAMVLQPKSAADIVRAVEFCKENDVGITVKVAGHSYFGASTAKNTLLIKMNPNYPKYAIDGSLAECDGQGIMAEEESNTSASMIPSDTDMACAVASSRGKNAVLRVGGGELFDEAYRSVSFDWNEANPDRKYHLVGGGAGTVSAAGGWMASGGLSGTTGMRLYGIGIDQVVALEMVLPSGQHVRFGPTEWTEVEGEGYPKTSVVSGYCNAMPYETNEDLWEWTECEEEIDFNELWFAVRGGGGGTYGIVVSLHYQLHDYPGPLNYIFMGPDPAATTTPPEEVPGEALFLFASKYAEFLLTYLWHPEALNVTEADSRGCGSAQTMNFNPFCGGLLMCYGTSGPVFTQAWIDFVTEPGLTQAFQDLGMPEDWIAIVDTIMNNETFYESYAQQVLEGGADNPGVPEGRLADAPMAQLVPVLGGFPNVVDSTHTHFPLDAVQANIPGIAELLALDGLTNGACGSIYAMGGAIKEADDGLNSLSPTRRNAAFLVPVKDAEIRDMYYSNFYAGLDPSTGNFPGSSCHNHALVYEMGPVKTNWSQSCPLDWPQTEREAKCISQNEASWGTVNLARLNAFKAAIDPNNLLICTSGIGYSNPTLESSIEGEGEDTTMEESGDESTMDEGETEVTDTGEADVEEGDGGSSEETVEDEDGATGDKGEAEGEDAEPTSASDCLGLSIASSFLLAHIICALLDATY